MRKILNRIPSSILAAFLGIFALAITSFAVVGQIQNDNYNAKVQNYVLAKMAGYPVNVLGYISGKPFHVLDTSKLDAQLYRLHDQKTINQKRFVIYKMAGLI